MELNDCDDFGGGFARGVLAIVGGWVISMGWSGMSMRQGHIIGIIYLELELQAKYPAN
jgi:hypothetical protein